MRATRLVPAAAAVLIAAASALADNAAATLLPGDTLHGNIVTPGDRDVLSIYLPGGSVFSVDALAERGSAILPDLEMDDPDGDPVLLDLVKIPGPKGVGVRLRNLPIDEDAGGIYVFRVIATAASSGKYLFRCRARMPKKFAGTPLTGPMSFTSLAFDAPAGSTLRYSMKPITPGAVLSQPALVEPDDETRDLVVFAAAGIPLDEDGTWTLRVFNESAAEAEVAFTARLALPRSKRVLYLSTVAFGPAPRVSSVTPNKVLDNGPVAGMQILGSGFDPAAALRIERGNEAPLLPASFTVVDEGTITADFDFLGQAPGAWKVVVENPSGGAGSGRLAIRPAAGVRLPHGVAAATEVWWLDFDETAFQEDLRLAGLQSATSVGVSALAEGALKSYVVRWLRVAFDLDPQTGKTAAGSVPVSFILSKPPATVGGPGTSFNRLVIGGAAGMSDPSSNPNYAWGNGPLDTGNAVHDDLAPSADDGSLGLRSRFLSASSGSSVPAFHAALKALRDQPLGPDDARYFLSGFAARDGVEGQRYAEVVLAFDKAGKELAGTIAHFVARAMGTPDGPTGLAATPMKVGEFDALLDFGFTAPETAALVAAAKTTGLPGKSKTLNANHFPYSETRAYLLPNSLTGKAYGETFAVAGGRPERDPGDIEFVYLPGILAPGVLPPGITVATDGTVSGTPPLRFGDGTLVGGAYRLLVRMRDKRTGALIFFQHRINVLVDTSNPGLSPAEVQLGTQRNSATVNEP